MFDLVEPLLGLTFLGSVVGGVLYAQRRRIARLSVELVAPWAEAKGWRGRRGSGTPRSNLVFTRRQQRRNLDSSSTGGGDGTGAAERRSGARSMLPSLRRTRDERRTDGGSPGRGLDPTKTSTV